MEKQIVLIDTSILVAHFRKGSDIFEYYCKLQDERKITLGVSVVTIFEYYSGVIFDNSISLQRADVLFEGFEIYDLDKHVAKIAARINNQRKLQQRIEIADIFIGSTALRYDIQMLTENKKHFKLIPGIKFAK